MVWVWLLLAVLTSGCTGYVGYNASDNASDNASVSDANVTLKPGFTDLCTNVACSPSKVKCPDGFVVACSNYCINESGECTQCVPRCEGHLTRSCENVVCKDMTYQCPDGFIASCQQSCYKGLCVSCTPDCTGHYQEEQSSSSCEGKNCGSTNITCPDYYVATCSNTCSGANCISCTPSCSGHEISHLMFSEAMYDTTASGDKDEWLELYNPLEISIALTNWTISDNSGTWKFGDVIIAKKSSLVIAKNATAFQQSFNCFAHVTGFTRTLNNDGDQLTLKDNNGNDIDFVAWEKGANGAYPAWDVTAEEGLSVRRINLTIDSDGVSDWSAGTPQPNC